MANYKLQILVPQYDETDEIIKPLLDSIQLQQNIDFQSDISVIIANDGSSALLSQEFLDSYPYKIEYILAEHKGVSATRNVCLDHATADYVMFCDADDMFYNLCGIWVIFQEIKKGEFDTLVSTFVHEVRTVRGEVAYLNKSDDVTFVHGKVHRLQYLRDNNIRWNESLTIHEDSYFNYLCLKLATNVRKTQATFYMWRYRADSVCRRDPKYLQKTYTNLLDSNDACIERLKEANHTLDANHLAISAIYECYFTMNKEPWMIEENREYRVKTLKRFKQFYDKYKDSLSNVSRNDLCVIVKRIRMRVFDEGVISEKFTFYEFIEEVNRM